jgi:hypothetical protein
MKLIINIILSLAVLGLAYWLFVIINKPIQKKKLYKLKKEAITTRLIEGKEAQDIFKKANDSFATNWNDLIGTIKTKKIQIVKQIGDPNDSTVQVITDTSYVPLLDSLQRVLAVEFDEIPNYKFNIDSLKFIPYTDKKEFEIYGGNINQNGVPVPVFEISEVEPYISILLPDAEEKPLKVGSRNEAIYDGNWK